jgi:uncharacterized phage protein gp47/JayE
MPPPYGLTAEGFSRPTVEELRAIINQRIWDSLGPTIDLSDRSLEGHIVGIVCEVAVSLWELGESSTASFDPDKAVDAALDAVCIITGTTRRGAFASTVVLTLTGDDATPIPAASAARVEDGPRFETLADGTLEALDAWVGLTAYVVGDRVTANGNAYHCITAGISANGGGGPHTTDPVEADGPGTLEWRYLGEGVAANDFPTRASAAGPLVANSGTITEIVTPVGGWKGVINLLDATPGSNQMSNEALRVLRMVELARPGHGSIDAIEADLIDEANVPGVRSVTVFNNPSDSVVDGMPPHSVEAMVTGGEDQAIWTQLLKSVGGGIKTHGDVIGTAVDRRGRSHTMAFTRPTAVPIYIALTVVRDPLTFPDDGEDAIKEAVVAWGNAQANGKNAVASRIAAASFIDESVLDVAALISVAPAPSSDVTIAIGPREQATYDTIRIAITFVDGVP